MFVDISLLFFNILYLNKKVIFLKKKGNKLAPQQDAEGLISLFFCIVNELSNTYGI
jgi:hypothetical protein